MNESGGKWTDEERQAWFSTERSVSEAAAKNLDRVLLFLLKLLYSVGG